MSLLRNPLALLAAHLTTLLAVGSSTFLLRSHMVELSEDHEARMVSESLWLFKERLTNTNQDELEGTLRGHIGLIEEALDRLEGKAIEADRGKTM